MQGEGVLRRSTVSSVGLLVGGLVALGTLLFTAAGTLVWPRGWLWLSVLGIGFAVHDAVLTKCNPGLLRRRRRIGRGTPAWDLVLVGLTAAAFLVTVVVSASDARSGGSLSLAFSGIGVVVHVVGMATVTWAMATSPFFESTVRLQREEGHQVIDTGPYARVRHPGYVGFSLIVLAIPAILGSRLGLLPAAGMVFALALRTRLEERFLREELPGYADYMRRVRFRWIPGVW